VNNIGNSLCRQRLFFVVKFIAERELAFTDGGKVRSPRNFFQKHCQSFFQAKLEKNKMRCFRLPVLQVSQFAKLLSKIMLHHKVLL